MPELKAKQIRRYRKMSREEVAVHFGVSAETIKRWETKPDALRIPEAIEMAKLYDVTLDQLAGLEPLPWLHEGTTYHVLRVDLTEEERAKVEAFAEGLKAGR